MDFDLDDPLRDLLSDDSNDSFFEDRKKRSPPSKDTKQTKVSELFGIGGSSKPSVPRESNTSDVKEPTTQLPDRRESTSAASTTQIHEIQSSTKGANEANTTLIRPASAKSNHLFGSPATAKPLQKAGADDLLDELGFDPKNPRAAPKKKANIIDDILNFSKIAVEPNTTSASIPTKKPPAISTPTKKPPAILDERRASRTVESSKPIESSATMASSKPLDLFGSMTRQTSTEGRGSRSKGTLKQSASIDWLGLGADKDPIEKQPVAKRSTEIVQPTGPSQPTQVQQVIVPKSEPLQQIQANTTEIPKSIAVNSSVDYTDKLETGLRSDERVVQSLQHQANQLQTTISIRQQESALIDMQSKQQSLIDQQEKQFNELVQRQCSRQLQLESQIQQQQQQINSYINALMQQPNIQAVSLKPLESSRGAADNGDIVPSSRVELETEVKRLELEKLRLEDTLENVRGIYDQEMELVRTSHKY